MSGTEEAEETGRTAAMGIDHLNPGDELDEAARSWLKSRIAALRSRASASGPFRAAGMERTIAGMKAQLRDGRWNPHGSPEVGSSHGNGPSDE